MRLPASSMTFDAEQTLPFPPDGRNMDRIPKAAPFVKYGPQRIRFHISGSIKVPDTFNPSQHRRITADPSDHNFPYCGMLERHNQWR